jgi:hypothetical protein
MIFLLLFCAAAVVFVAACGALLSFSVLQTKFRCVRESVGMGLL